MKVVICMLGSYSRIQFIVKILSKAEWSYITSITIKSIFAFMYTVHGNSRRSKENSLINPLTTVMGHKYL